MNVRWPAMQRWALTWLIGLAGLIGAVPAMAHLMVAQRGTVNIVGNGGFVVMSFDVDAFTGIDDDGDGRLSMAEMRTHAGAIERQVQQGLTLTGPDGPRALEGLMLNLSPDDNAPTEPARHLVVLGRFALAEGDLADAGPGQTVTPLRLGFTLFGKSAKTEQARQHQVTQLVDRPILLRALRLLEIIGE